MAAVIAENSPGAYLSAPAAVAALAAASAAFFSASGGEAGHREVALGEGRLDVGVRLPDLAGDPQLERGQLGLGDSALRRGLAHAVLALETIEQLPVEVQERAVDGLSVGDRVARAERVAPQLATSRAGEPHFRQ